MSSRFRHKTPSAGPVYTRRAASAQELHRALESARRASAPGPSPFINTVTPKDGNASGNESPKVSLAPGEPHTTENGRDVAREETPWSLIPVHALTRSSFHQEAKAPTDERKKTHYAAAFLEKLPTVGAVYTPKQPATQKLQALIEEHYYKAAFEIAIQAVSEQRIPELDAIKTLYQFYFYVDELVTWIPEIRVWDWYGEQLHERTVYLRITQFYYYFNQRELEALQSPVAPEEGVLLSPISTWLRDFALEWGSFLGTEESGKYLESFKYAPEYNWQDYEKEPQQYETFNDFFARKFKDIDIQRPVARASDDRVIVFPAESTFVGQWAVSTPVGEPLSAPASIVVKHIQWPIIELLKDSEYAKFFEGGLFTHSFLNTYDYHRQHTPVAGRVLEARFIPGQVYLEVNLSDQGEDASGDLARAVIPQRYLDAEDPTGYQFVQCRGLLVLETRIGKVAILPMGMAQVSSVVFVTPETDGQTPIELTPEDKAKYTTYPSQVARLNEKLREQLVGKEFKKGEMFSFFQFGGSDCVMVFERKANVNVTATVNVHYPVRSQFGVSNINW